MKDYTVPIMVEMMVANAAKDYRFRADLARRERRMACVIAEMRGDPWQQIAARLIEIDKKHGIHVAANPSETLENL